MAEEEVSNRIFTAANVVSFIRLCLVPTYLIVLLSGYDIAATIIFAVAACTDFLDGQIARRTHTVTKLGQVLDPAVDRLLMLCGVIGLLLVGRLPLWIVVLVVARDVFLLCGGAFLLARYNKRIAVIYPGKFATTFLFIGFAGLLLNFPILPGLGLVDVAWLPGIGGAASWGIWFVYAGLALALGTTVYYIWRGWHAFQEGRAEKRAAAAQAHGA